MADNNRYSNNYRDNNRYRNRNRDDPGPHGPCGRRNAFLV